MLILLIITVFLQLVTSAPTTYDCNVPSDLIFVLDGSDSLKEAEFNATKQFVKDVLQQLAVEKQYVQVGVIVYSTFVGGTIDLGAFTTYGILQIFIDNLNQPRQGTATDIAINSMKTMFDNRAANRQNVRKIGIILTDGRSTSPTSTINAANAAKAAGVELFSIGYGTDVFVYELEQIATDPSTTMLLTNSMVDPAFMADFMEKLKIRICDPITTTMPAPTTTMTMPPSTQKLVTDDLCPNCMKDINTGYKAYPGDCTKYIDVRPDENGGSIQEVKKCPFGTFWDSTVLTCQYSWMVNCAYDPCGSYASGTLAMPGVCSGYWTCTNFRANASCCAGLNQRYVQGIGCMQDFSCTTPCPDDDSNKLIQPQQCYRYAYQLDQSKYYEENHGTNITRSCAPGTWFDQQTCSCSIMSGINTAPLQKHQQLQHISLGQTRWKTPFHNFVSGNRREKSLEIWQTLNKELLEERAVLLDGKEFFHIWQAQRRPVLKDVFLFETGACGADVYFDFNSNSVINDISGNGVIVGNRNTALNGQSAVFSGNSNLNIWRFSNMDFRTKLTIEFQFTVLGFGSASEAMVSNCIGSDVEEASILIVAQRSSNTVLFRTVTYLGAAEVTVNYNPSLQNSVTYVYDGKKLTGIVNNVVQQTVLTGDIQTRQTGIIIGAASKSASFQGQIDEFKCYKCFPGSVGQYVTP